MGVQDVLFVTLVQLGQGLVAGAFMAYYNWKLFLVVAAVAPLLAWVFNVFRRKLSESYRKVQESFSRVTATLAESVTGIKVTQGFNQGEFLFEVIRQAADIMVGFDRHAWPACKRHRLNYIGIKRALRQKLHPANPIGTVLKDINEQPANNFPFGFRVADTFQFL